MTTPAVSQPGRVSSAARVLGFAGLLPQAFLCVALIAGRTTGAVEYRAFVTVAALFYGCAILSFLGGIWWGFAMRRTSGQGRLAAVSVIPSLVAAVLPATFGLGLWSAPPVMVALGGAILLTLLVDRHLHRTGEAPAGWMGLRVPLSVGLGLLTIAIGLLAPA